MPPLPPSNHPHTGHRARLRRRLETEGLAGFAPHEVIELLLCDAIPQRDVNPLAHRLIEQFGSVRGVLEADADALCGVSGMGEKSAAFLRLMGEAARVYESLPISDRPRLASVRELAGYCRTLFEPGAGEQMWTFNLNKTGRLLGSVQLAQGARKPPLREAVEPTLFCHGQAVILVFCRNPGDTAVRETDLTFVRDLALSLLRIRVSLLDGVILAGHEFVSLRKDGQYLVSEGGALHEPDTAALELWRHWLDE